MTFNFQGTSRHQGDDFERLCNDSLLTVPGLLILGKKRVLAVGVEVDQTIVRRGQIVWIEYKGSTRGKRPGLIRTDSMKKAIANGALTKNVRPGKFWVVTSHLPSGGAGSAMLVEARNRGYVDAFLLPGDLPYLAGML